MAGAIIKQVGMISKGFHWYAIVINLQEAEEEGEEVQAAVVATNDIKS